MFHQPVLVTGGTGAQGGATIDALLGDGRAVRALVRNPASSTAQALAAKGVELAQGDFDDEASLVAAMQGVIGVFSMQKPPLPSDQEAEIRAGRKLIDAAIAAGVDTFVHTSVSRAGDQANFVGWEEGRWWREYWDSKSGVNAMVRGSGLPHWVVLKPAYMMANYIPPKATHMIPALAESGELVTAMAPDVRLDLIDSADIGRFAAAAFADPTRLHGQDIDLAAESLTMTEIAATIAQATGKTVKAVHVSPEEAVARGYHQGLVLSEQWCNVEGYRVDLEQASRHGIRFSTFAEFAKRCADDFVIGSK